MSYIIPECILASKQVLLFAAMNDPKDFCSILAVSKKMWKLRLDKDLWDDLCIQCNVSLPNNITITEINKNDISSREKYIINYIKTKRNLIHNDTYFYNLYSIFVGSTSIYRWSYIIKYIITYCTRAAIVYIHQGLMDCGMIELANKIIDKYKNRDIIYAIKIRDPKIFKFDLNFMTKAVIEHEYRWEQIIHTYPNKLIELLDNIEEITSIHNKTIRLIYGQLFKNHNMLMMNYLQQRYKITENCRRQIITSVLQNCIYQFEVVMLHNLPIDINSLLVDLSFRSIHYRICKASLYKRIILHFKFDKTKLKNLRSKQMYKFIMTPDDK